MYFKCLLNSNLPKMKDLRVVLLLFLKLTCDLACFFSNLAFLVKPPPLFCFNNLICKIELIILSSSSISAMQMT